MLNRLALPIVVLLVAAAAFVHGAVTQRWAAFAPDPARTERMHALIVAHADAIAEEVPHDVPLKERSIATSRSYRSATSGLTAMVSLISGVPGAVSTHTPDVCYTASGYRMLTEPKRQTVTLPDGTTAEYLQADFEKGKATHTDRVRVRWAWSADGRWAAPEHARFAYVRSPELFKLYVVTPIPGDQPGAADPPAYSGFVAAAFAQYAAACR